MLRKNPLLFLATGLLLNACNTAPDFASAVSNTPRTFSAVQSTILLPKCGSCHSPPLSSGGVTITTYDDLIASAGAVVPYQPHLSHLFTQCYSGQMPQGGPRLSDSEIKLLYDWIAYGAAND